MRKRKLKVRERENKLRNREERRKERKEKPDGSVGGEKKWEANECEKKDARRSLLHCHWIDITLKRRKVLWKQNRNAEIVFCCILAFDL